MASTRVTGAFDATPGAGSRTVPAQPGPHRGDGSLLFGAPIPLLGHDLPVPAGVPVLWSWNAADGRVVCSETLRRTLDLPPDLVPGLVSMRGRVHPGDRELFDDLVLGVVRGRRPTQGRVRVVRRDGAVRDLHLWAACRRGPAGTTGAFGGAIDLTGVESGLPALYSGLLGLQAVEELTGVGLWEWHPDSGELLWSAAMYPLFGAAPGELEPTLQGWHRAVHPHDQDRVHRLDVGRVAAADGRGEAETLRVTGLDGVLRHVRCWSARFRGPAGDPVVHGAAIEVSRQIRDRVQLERLSATDPVTGLMNRHGLTGRLRHLLAGAEGRLAGRAARHAARPDDDAAAEVGDVSLLLLDLDRFKAVNDALGHHVGDALLVEVARRLDDLVPPGTATARMGGDEFAVVPPPGTTDDEVRALAETIVAALRLPHLLPESREPLTCPASVGVTSRGGRPVGVEELLAEADLALYRAKDSGRARYVRFDVELRTRARERHRAERLLRAAFENDGFVLQYQPVVDLTGGEPVGAEALIRIRDVTAEDGERLLAPEAFIDVAEDTGLVVDLDCWVVDHALDELARRYAESDGEPPWLAVNVSPRSMEHPQVAHRIVDGLAARGLPAHLLKVELTERSFLSPEGEGTAALRTLLASGVPVGIDDFGTGYSALAYLQLFDLDFMKIDRSFVASVGAADRADAVVTAIVALAHAHGMRVTAEGVESAEQAARLREIGCDLGQGYHFGRPASAVRPG